MAGKLARRWTWMKASAAVLRPDKSLLLFPLISNVCTLLVAASFLIAVAGEHAGRQGLSPGACALLFGFYLVQYCMIIFFNTVLAGAALRHLRGESTRFADGMAACSVC